MKLITGLLIILLTLFWVVISFVGYLEEKSILTVGVVTFIYCLLLYIVWPLGKPNSYISIQRLFIGLGIGMLLMAIDILFRSDCPILPTYTIIMARNPGGLLFLTSAICTYIGKIPASLIPIGFGLYLFRFAFGNKTKEIMGKDKLKNETISR